MQPSVDPLLSASPNPLLSDPTQPISPPNTPTPKPSSASDAISNLVSDPMEGERVKLGSVQLQVSYTPGKTPAVVFIHGGLGRRLNWRSQWEFLRAQGRAVLAYDLAGHGESEHYRRYSIGRYRRDLTRLLRHFKLHTPVLCCHSYGVPIGIEWATRHHASALILIGGGTHNLTPWWEIPLVKLLGAGGYQVFDRYPQMQTWLNTLSSPAPSDTLHRFFQENPLPQNPHPYRAMESFWDYDGRLSKLSCPVLVLTGEKDPVFPPPMGRALALHYSRTGLHSWHISVPAAGHLVMAEAPELVNQAILQMLPPESAIVPLKRKPGA